MLSVFLIHIAFLMSLPALSNSRSIVHLGVHPVSHMILIANMICGADLLQMLPWSALVKIPMMLSTFLRCTVSLAPSGLPVSPTSTRSEFLHRFTRYLIDHFWLFFVTDPVFRVDYSIFLNVVCGLTAMKSCMSSIFH